MTYLDWLNQATSRLRGAESPKRDAEILLGFVTKKNRTFLMAFNETFLQEKELQQLEVCLKKRERGVPIAYITGQKEFWSLPFHVNDSTLIPRPDTEKLVELALEYLPNRPCEVLDLGTGAGTVAIALATERPDCFFTGIDISKRAVALATQNAETIRVKNTQFLVGNWFKPIRHRKFTMIVSNPPYINSEAPHLQEGDLRFEPSRALISGDNGLADIKFIIKKGTRHLQQYGWLLLEHGWLQGREVQMLFKQSGYQLVNTYLDYNGNDRVTIGRWFKP